MKRKGCRGFDYGKMKRYMDGKERTMTTTDLAFRDLDAGEPVAPLARQEVPISAILANAVERGVGVEQMERLVALYERVQATKAIEEFATAMAGFQAACPPVNKTSTAKVTSKRTGAAFSYNYAELDEIARHIAPHMKAHGLSYTWDSEMKDGLLVCTCTVHHSKGHSRSAKFGCQIDTEAAMSASQQVGAALTYARRQTLIQALGLTTGDPDTDGARRPPVSVEKITAHQAANLDTMITSVGADKDRFMRFMGVGALADIPASEFQRAVTALESKRKQA